MRNESVAVLDVRSYEVTFYLGSKGVNDTFVFCGSHTEEYEGFSKEGFFDEESFRRAVVAAITTVRQNYEGVIGEIYVGVPTAFLTLQTKGHTLSFPRKRKISAQDIDLLYESGLNGLLSKERCIRRFNMYLTLGDNRKYFSANDLFGVPTTLLKGALCYYFVADCFFDVIHSVLGKLGFNKIYLLPTSLAQSLYLLPEQKREGYAFLLDVGFLTSSISVVYGNGIVHEETFDCGLATALVGLMQELNVDYATAKEILSTTDVSGGAVSKDLLWTSEQGDVSFPQQDINDIVKYALDILCEKVENFFMKHYREKDAEPLTVNPISLTGEGMAVIKGASEHISKRLNRLTEIVFPDLPYYDKPIYSSRLALLDMAFTDRVKRGWLYRLFNNIGGKKR